MRANVSQSADLMRFIRYLNVNVNGDIVTNVIDDEQNFISKFYTPHFRANKISATILDLIADNNIGETNKSLSKDSLTYKFLNSGLKLTDPYIYSLAQVVILESFALIYAIEEQPTLYKNIQESDIATTRETVKYICDYLGENSAYTDLIMDLHSMDVALGYIQKQLPLIQGGLEINGTL